MVLTIFGWIAGLIALGLLLSQWRGATSLAGTGSSGLVSVIKALQLR